MSLRRAWAVIKVTLKVLELLVSLAIVAGGFWVLLYQLAHAGKHG